MAAADYDDYVLPLFKHSRGSSGKLMSRRWTIIRGLLIVTECNESVYVQKLADLPLMRSSLKYFSTSFAVSVVAAANLRQSKSKSTDYLSEHHIDLTSHHHTIPHTNPLVTHVNTTPETPHPHTNTRYTAHYTITPQHLGQSESSYQASLTSLRSRLTVTISSLSFE